MAKEKPFEFSVNLKELLVVYSLIQNGIGKKSEKPILRTIHAELGEDTLTLRTFNHLLDITKTMEVKVKAGKGQKFCFDPFVFEVLAKYPDPDPDSNVTWKQKTDNTGKILPQFSVSQKDRAYDFNTINAKDFPEPLQVSGWGAVNIAQLLDVFTLVDVAILSIKEADRPALQCFHVVPDHKEEDNEKWGYVAATDGTQVALYDNLPNLPGGKCLPRARLFSGLDPLFKNIVDNGQYNKDDSEEHLYPNDGEAIFGGGENNAWTGFRSKKARLTFYISQRNDPLFDIYSLFDGKVIRKNISAEEIITFPCSITVEVGVLSRLIDICCIYESRALEEGKSNYTTLEVDGEKATLSISISDLSGMKEDLPLYDSPQEHLNYGSYTLTFKATRLKELLDLRPIAESNLLTFSFLENNEPFIVQCDMLPNFLYMQTQGQ